MKPEDFADWVRLMKAQRKWSKTDIARELGTNPNAIRRFMRQESPRLLGLAVTALMLDADPWPQAKVPRPIDEEEDRAA